MSDQKRSITLLTRKTIGLAIDAKVIGHSLLENGHEVTIRFPRGRNFDLFYQRILKHAHHLCCRNSNPSVNLFIEQIMPSWLALAQVNLFIPNQEWCRPETIDLLPKIDLIMCKTHYAETCFQKLGHRVAYIGFTSEDRFNEQVVKDYSKCLHVAGRSLQKGTVILAKLWAMHPEWPLLTVVTKNPQLIAKYAAQNIRIVSKSLSDVALRQIQNEHGIHVCPSEAEGFGHHIGEALGCGALVITTNAPPMNELVTNERGILVPYCDCQPQSLGTNFYIDPAKLEDAIKFALGMPDYRKKKIGESARVWFLENAKAFDKRFINVLTTILNNTGCGGTAPLQPISSMNRNVCERRES